MPDELDNGEEVTCFPLRRRFTESRLTRGGFFVACEDVLRSHAVEGIHAVEDARTMRRPIRSAPEKVRVSLRKGRFVRSS